MGNPDEFTGFTTIKDLKTGDNSKQVYKCPTCGSTKTIYLTGSGYGKHLPKKLVCYYQGCEDYCIPVSGPLNEE